jgi:hypothetical protein
MMMPSAKAGWAALSSTTTIATAAMNWLVSRLVGLVIFLLLVLMSALLFRRPATEKSSNHQTFDRMHN